VVKKVTGLARVTQGMITFPISEEFMNILEKKCVALEVFADLNSDGDYVAIQNKFDNLIVSVKLQKILKMKLRCCKCNS